MPSRWANSWSDRARPLTSSSNHARPRAIALISAGSHLELCFGGANPGRTNLVSAPRRVKAAVAVSSTALSLAASNADDATSPPNRRPRRSLMMIVFSSTMIFSTSSRTSFARSPGGPPSAAAIRAARLSSFRTWSLGMPAAPNRSTKFPNLRIPQILHEDAEALAVGELVVGTTSAGEVGVEFETMPYVAGNYERGCYMIDVEQEDVALGLPARILHHHVPVARDAASAQLLRFASRDRK